MGCFLGCFGGSKDAKRRKKKNKVIPKTHSYNVQSAPETTTFTEQVTAETGKEPINLVPELRSEAEEPQGPSPRKRVTFDSNVTTHEPVSIYESIESLADTGKVGEKEKKEYVVPSREDNPSSGDDSVTSSDGSYPANYRYQNCRESDDEAEECGDSDLDDEDDDEDDREDYGNYGKNGDGRIVSQERDVWSESVITASMELRTKNLIQANSEEVKSPFEVPGLGEQETKVNAEKGYVRERSVYIHSVLNPVENFTQWKAVKSNGSLPLNPQKENYTAEQLEVSLVSLGTEPTFKQSPSSFKSKPNQHKNSNQEMAVDASLSNWLVSQETTPRKKASCDGIETITSERSLSRASNSAISFEDRPILGALTVEELKQLSATSSSRRSPSRSPDDMPIIGTVGTYWSHTNSAKDSSSASSFKGIPNTTSKYREDKRVNWHSTPFETRLERALKRNATEA